MLLLSLFLDKLPSVRLIVIKCEELVADLDSTSAELADDGGRTLLHRAALIGNEEAVKFMLKLGSKIDEYSKFKETPLHLAIRNNRLACVKVLVEALETFAAEADMLLLKGAKPDRARFAPIPKNFKGAVLTPDMVKAWKELTGMPQ